MAEMKEFAGLFYYREGALDPKTPAPPRTS
jgi:hypothetical protein